MVLLMWKLSVLGDVAHCFPHGDLQALFLEITMLTKPLTILTDSRDDMSYLGPQYSATAATGSIRAKW